MINRIENLTELVQATNMLDYHAPNIQELVVQRGWNDISDKAKVACEIYNFCKDEILFGYNSKADDIPASSVLKEGIGHCNTKTTLLMALLRVAKIPCRLHAFTIHKALQKGAMTPFVYFMAPKEIIHTWAEAWVDESWLALEGIILDRDYLNAIQERFSPCANHEHPFLGYAVATKSLNSPSVEWTGNSTFIQREGIARELGTYKSPDDFYSEHKTNLRGVKGWLYKSYFYKRLNENISNIRQGNIPAVTVKQDCEKE